MRKISLALIGFGVFLIVLAPMVRFYAYPKLAVAPVNQRSVTTLVGEDATIFDIGTLKEIQTTLTTKVNTVGDSTTPKSSPGDVTYVNSTSTVSADGVMRSRDVERMTFDARTGLANPNCCSDFVSDTEGVQTPIKHKGLVAKFPFNTQKKDYPFWDGDLRDTRTIKYQGTETIEGVTTYKFAQTIDAVQVGTQEVPLSVLGLPGDSNVEAAKMYSNVRTLWVEPETGAVIKRIEQQNNTFDYQGESRVTTTKATVVYDDATVKANADEYGGKAPMLHMMRATVPQGAFVVGLLMMVGGFVLGRRRSAAPGQRTRELQDLNA